MAIISSIIPQPLSKVQATAKSTHQLFLPTIHNGDPVNCRFGLNAIEPFANVQIDNLPIGWYVDYHALTTSTHPHSAHYARTIRLTQTGSNATDYTYIPNKANLIATISSNPGVVWLIGNEPDRRDFQDDIEPHVYAAAYHELYTLIKAADDSAQIYAGTIVQPTPLRLQYLDMILDSYLQQNNAPLPADGWSIHNFILNEVSCNHDPDNCWGAEIPPGIDAPTGEILSIDDNDNINIFQHRIVAFRQWMVDNGYRNLPLLVSEYGILMPDWLGFPPERVNAYMSASVDYMLHAVNSTLGNPYDGGRLVQGWSWYSTGAPTDDFNGYLFSGNILPRPLSTMGQNYAELLAKESPEVDYYPISILSEPIANDGSVTVELQAPISNSGNTVISAQPVTVQFFNGNPTLGGVQIGATQIISLPGCGYQQTATIIWSDISVGTYEVFVKVDADNRVSEVNEANNLMSAEIIISSTH